MAAAANVNYKLSQNNAENRLNNGANFMNVTAKKTFIAKKADNGSQ